MEPEGARGTPISSVIKHLNPPFAEGTVFTCGVISGRTSAACGSKASPQWRKLGKDGGRRCCDACYKKAKNNAALRETLEAGHGEWKLFQSQPKRKDSTLALTMAPTETPVDAENQNPNPSDSASERRGASSDSAWPISLPREAALRERENAVLEREAAASEQVQEAERAAAALKEREIAVLQREAAASEQVQEAEQVAEQCRKREESLKAREVEAATREALLAKREAEAAEHEEARAKLPVKTSVELAQGLKRAAQLIEGEPGFAARLASSLDKIQQMQIS